MKEIVTRTDNPRIKQAYIAVMLKRGETWDTIRVSLGVSKHTIAKVKKGLISPDKALIKAIKDNHINDLDELGFLARESNRQYLGDVLTGKEKYNPIAQTAIQDRSFQQAQLLKGEPTAIYDTRMSLSDSVATAHRIKDLESKIARAITLTKDEDGVYSA
jgi:hypothetical protein